MSGAVESAEGLRRFRPYPGYKDSDLDWVPSVPEHWQVSKLGACCSVKARLGWKALKASEYVDDGYIFLATPNIKDKEIDFEAVNYITESRYLESPEIMLQVGDVLVAKDGSTLGISNVVRQLPECATVNSSIAVIRPRVPLDSVYLYYFFSSEFTQGTIQSLKGGMGVPHLFQADLRKFVLIGPPVSEQRAVAEFLDRETGKIDALVAKKERLIELLQEKRTALITHAVTKGLDPTAPKKPSGIDWLGDIPAHWEAGALNRWWDVIDCKHRTVPFVDEGMPVASIGEVHGLEVDLSSANRTTEEEYRQMIGGGRDPRPGDIIYSRNATIGTRSETSNTFHQLNPRASTT